MNRLTWISAAILVASIAAWRFVQPEQPLFDLQSHDPNRPDATADHLEGRVYDAKGNLHYRFSAKHAEHYFDEERSELTSPEVLILQQDKTKSWLASAESGSLFGVDNITLAGNVNAEALHQDAQVRRFNTPWLHVDLLGNFATTPYDVSVIGANMKQQGKGLRVDLETQSYQIKEQVNAQFTIPPRDR